MTNTRNLRSKMARSAGLLALGFLLLSPPSAWAQVSKKAAFSEGAEFGHGLAASESLLAVGARGPTNLQGAVYLYRKQKDSWQPIAALCPKKLAEQRFGERVAVSDRALIVGHYYETAGGVPKAGAAYVYEIPKAGTTVGPAQQIAAARPERMTGFGDGVAAHGELVFASSPADGDGGSTSIFSREGAKWKLRKKLVAERADQGEGADQMFGNTIAIDAGTLVIGAPSFGGIGGREGAAWVFARDKEGLIEGRPTLLRCGTHEAKRMGSSVAISGDLIVLGDDAAVVNGHEYAGQLFAFQRRADGTFPPTPTAVLTASDPQKNAMLGFSLGVVGGTILAGAVERNGKTGAVYAFEPVAGDAAGWKQTAVIEGSGPGAMFGVSLAVSGSQLIVGELRGLAGEGQVQVYSIESPISDRGPKKLETLVRPTKLIPR